jgi:hypothetical protein
MDRLVCAIVESADPGRFVSQIVRDSYRGPTGEGSPGAREVIERSVAPESIGDLKLPLTGSQSSQMRGQQPAGGQRRLDKLSSVSADGRRRRDAFGSKYCRLAAAYLAGAARSGLAL